jgi:hypothetical protein
MSTSSPTFRCAAVGVILVAVLLVVAPPAEPQGGAKATRASMADKQIVNGKKKMPSYITITDLDAPFDEKTEVKDYKATDTSRPGYDFHAKVVHRKKARMVIRLKPNDDHPKKAKAPDTTGSLSITLTTAGMDTDYTVPVEYVMDEPDCGK